MSVSPHNEKTFDPTAGETTEDDDWFGYHPGLLKPAASQRRKDPQPQQDWRAHLPADEDWVGQSISEEVLEGPRTLVPVRAIQELGNVPQALVFSRLLYWCAPHNRRRRVPMCTDDGFYWLTKTHRGLAAETGLSARTVRNAVGELARKGLVLVEYVASAGGRTSRFRIVREVDLVVREDDEWRRVYVPAWSVRYLRSTGRHRGHAEQALVLGQVLYWFRPRRDGTPRIRVRLDERFWLAKSHAELANEVGLSRQTVRTSLDVLEGEGLIVSRCARFQGIPTTHLRPDARAIENAMLAVESDRSAALDESEE